jgi:hypothetical protein
MRLHMHVMEELHPGRKKREQAKQQGKTKSPRNRREDSEAELEECLANCGFTEEEAFELLCQGVEPWDDDADVSNVLHMHHYHDVE